MFGLTAMGRLALGQIIADPLTKWTQRTVPTSQWTQRTVPTTPWRVIHD
jgi:hypothetical protein